MGGETVIAYYVGDVINTATIEELYNNPSIDTIIVPHYSEGRVECMINKFNKPIEYEIILDNWFKASINTTADHFNKVYGREFIQTKYLFIDNYLAYTNNISYCGIGWSKIEKINRVINGPKVSYCLEVLDKDVEPVFTLANGIIMHV